MLTSLSFGSLIHKIGINLLHRVVMKVERQAESKGSGHVGDCQDRIARTFSRYWHMTFPGGAPIAGLQPLLSPSLSICPSIRRSLLALCPREALLSGLGCRALGARGWGMQMWPYLSSCSCSLPGVPRQEQGQALGPPGCPRLLLALLSLYYQQQ